MVYSSPPPNPADIRMSRINEYERYKGLAKAAEQNNDNDHWGVFTNRLKANRVARFINEPTKYPALDLTAPFTQLDSGVALQALLLNHSSAQTDPQLSGKLQPVLIKAIDEGFENPGAQMSVTLKPEIMVIDTGTLSDFKDSLRSHINLLTDTAQRERALWAALIPGSVVREIIHLPTSSFGMGTSMGRGTFKKVVDELVKLQNDKTTQPDHQDPNFKAVDTLVVAALQTFKEANARGFYKFIGKLQTHQHARVLYEALPANLTAGPPLVTLESTVNSREPVSGANRPGKDVDPSAVVVNRSSFIV